jgi:hypothetical protein
MRPPLERARTRIDTSGGPDACWPYVGAHDGDGYGQVSTRRGQAPAKVHRLVLEDTIGRSLSAGERACHVCDNPPCANPAHLFVGSVIDNARDAVAKGRIGSNPNSLANLRPGQPGQHGASEVAT